MISCTHSRRVHMHVWQNFRSQRSHEKRLDLKKSAQNVSMFCMLARETRQKAAVRPDKVEHFTRTFESLSPEIYTGMRIASADNMYVYCTARFRYARFRTGLRENRIAGVRLRGDWLYLHDRVPYSLQGKSPNVSGMICASIKILATLES